MQTPVHAVGAAPIYYFYCTRCCRWAGGGGDLASVISSCGCCCDAGTTALLPSCCNGKLTLSTVPWYRAWPGNRSPTQNCLKVASKRTLQGKQPLALGTVQKIRDTECRSYCAQAGLLCRRFGELCCRGSVVTTRNYNQRPCLTFLHPDLQKVPRIPTATTITRRTSGRTSILEWRT